jgi:hypothetical protein
MRAVRGPEGAGALLQVLRIETAGPERGPDGQQESAEHPLTELLRIPGVIFFQVNRQLRRIAGGGQLKVETLRVAVPVLETMPRGSGKKNNGQSYGNSRNPLPHAAIPSWHASLAPHPGEIASKKC